MKLLSISIAAYNVEKYLDKTLTSLCDQRYVDDLEILVVDDGSKDGTHFIAEKYQKLYPNSVQYVYKENGGHGSTINKGMENATGKYFRVIDGDDSVDPDAFAQYIKLLKNQDNDMFVSNYWRVDAEGNRYPNNDTVFDRVQEGKSKAFDEAIDTRFFGLDTITVKTDLLKKSNAHITEHCYYVDVEFIAWAIYVSNSYIYYNNKNYLYLCVNTSQNSVNKDNMLKNVHMQRTVDLHLCELFKQFRMEGSFNIGKQTVLLERIALSVGATYRTYLLYDTTKEAREKIKKLDSEIDSVSSDIYKSLNNDQFIRSIRTFGYAGVGIIRAAYLLYLNRKNKGWNK